MTNMITVHKTLCFSILINDCCGLVKSESILGNAIFYMLSVPKTNVCNGPCCNLLNAKSPAVPCDRFHKRREDQRPPSFLFLHTPYSGLPTSVKKKPTQLVNFNYIISET